MSLVKDIKENCTLGLYSALRARRAMVLRSKRTSRFTVATIFLADGKEGGGEKTVSKAPFSSWRIYASHLAARVRVHSRCYLLQRWHDLMRSS